jgi:signal transduction histidine kinase
MSLPCPHCGRGPEPAAADAALAAEVSELRAYCSHLERVVSSETTASAVLHDLRSVLMALGVLLERDLEHGGLGTEARRAADLARQLVTQRAPQCSNDTCQPNEILVRLQHVLAVLVPGKLVLELGANLGGVAMAPLRLQRIILNLVANAGDAAGPEGTVHVATTRSGSSVVLTVTDDGEGIPPGDYDRLAKPTFTTKEGGTGLGLALVTRSIEEAGGRLHVSSEPRGGTTMRVELPGRRVRT